MTLRKDYDNERLLGKTMIDFFDLQLFAGEGGAAGTGDGSGNGSNTASAAGSQGLLRNVRYGKQSVPDSGNRNIQTETADNSAMPNDNSAKFDELIKGEYKDAFTKKTQGIIDKRFAETKTLERYRDDVSPIIDLLYQKYGVSDLSGLTEAINDDASYWESAAEAEGLTVEQYKTKQRLERENRQLRALQEQQVREHQRQEQYQRWIAEGDRLKQQYPQFDLRAERKNPQFVDLLTRGIDVKTAFEVIHMDDIKMMSRQAGQRATMKSVQANGARPRENGVAAQSGVVTKRSARDLTKADREEIIRRVQRGEHIEF